MGNIQSIQGALVYLGFENRVANTAEQILGSTHLILPGVGSFAKAMTNIRDNGLLDALNKSVLEQRVPIMGICLGMQLFADSGDEDGPSEGLGWISGKVRRISDSNRLKVPHIGFNTAFFASNNRALFDSLGSQGDFYFVHSYVFDCMNEEDVSSRTEYGERFVSSVQRNNIFGTQFHPEKSQSNGLIVLRNFATQ
jgi:glutamine amidotransferase